MRRQAGARLILIAAPVPRVEGQVKVRQYLLIMRSASGRARALSSFCKYPGAERLRASIKEAHRRRGAAPPGPIPEVRFCTRG